MTDLKGRFEILKDIIRDKGSCAVAFSGGVDSTFLLAVSHELLKERCIAITSDSPLIPRHEAKTASDFCREKGIKQIVFDPDVLSDPLIRENSADRCYFCKKTIFYEIMKIASDNGIDHVFDGTNKDDEGDFRPGMKALTELGVESPLRQAGLTKKDIRELSKEMGLDTWDMPSFACLATRIPYGQEITTELLGRIESAEKILREEGFKQYRVRAHGDLARIEVMPCDMDMLLKKRALISEGIKDAGFKFVTMDLAGYKTGSMNDVLS